MRDAPQRTLAHPRPRLVAALLVLLVLGAAGAAAGWSVQPQAARDAAAPHGEFSAARAFEHVKAMATEPHPIGSAANDKVRTYLMQQLEGVGLRPEVQDTITEQGGELSGSEGGIAVARVRNVIATIPGSSSTGRVFLVAHYDSVQSGPGANDDLSGVSTILETARALSTGPQLRNDVVLVLTDGEEACLCGAQAFVEQHPLARDGGVVLNLEARGTTGPSVTFESSKDDAELISVLARAPKPVGTSVAVEVYRLLPNDTDFTPFRDAGFRGLNAAYIDGAAAYHGPTDIASMVDTDSLEHHGQNALALTRAFGGRDLTTLEARSDATYFTVPGGLAFYPGWLVWPIAVVALLAVLWLGRTVRKRELTTRARLWGGFGLGLVPVVLAPAAAQGVWALAVLIRPEYANVSVDPYRPLWFRLTAVAATAFVLFGWYALLRRMITPAALAVGGLGWLAVIGLTLAWFAPGGSYLASLPALAGAATGLLAVLARQGWGAVVVLLVGGAAAAVILVPLVILFFPAMGMRLAGTGAVIAVLLGLALLPLVELLHPEQGKLTVLPSALALLAVLGCGAVALRSPGFDDEHPEPSHLMYALDADTGTARWLSAEPDPGDWTAQFVDGAPADLSAELPALGRHEVLTGPAEKAVLPAPEVTVLGDTRSGLERTLRVRLRPNRPVRLATLHVGADATVLSASVNGRGIPVDRQAGGGWGFGFAYFAPGPEGAEVVLQVVSPGGKVRLRAMDASDGLDGLPGFQPRPANVDAAGTHTSDMLAVAKTYDF